MKAFWAPQSADTSGQLNIHIESHALLAERHRGAGRPARDRVDHRFRRARERHPATRAVAQTAYVTPQMPFYCGTFQHSRMPRQCIVSGSELDGLGGGWGPIRISHVSQCQHPMRWATG